MKLDNAKKKKKKTKKKKKKKKTKKKKEKKKTKVISDCFSKTQTCFGNWSAVPITMAQMT